MISKMITNPRLKRWLGAAHAAGEDDEEEELDQPQEEEIDAENPRKRNKDFDLEKFYETFDWNDRKPDEEEEENDDEETRERPEGDGIVARIEQRERNDTEGEKQEEKQKPPKKGKGKQRIEAPKAAPPSKQKKPKQTARQKRKQLQREEKAEEARIQREKQLRLKELNETFKLNVPKMVAEANRVQASKDPKVQEKLHELLYRLIHATNVEMKTATPAQHTAIQKALDRLSEENQKYITEVIMPQIQQEHAEVQRKIEEEESRKVKKREPDEEDLFLQGKAPTFNRKRTVREMEEGEEAPQRRVLTIEQPAGEKEIPVEKVSIPPPPEAVSKPTKLIPPPEATSRPALTQRQKMTEQKKRIIGKIRELGRAVPKKIEEQKEQEEEELTPAPLPVKTTYVKRSYVKTKMPGAKKAARVKNLKRRTAIILTFLEKKM